MRARWLSGGLSEVAVDEFFVGYQIVRQIMCRLLSYLRPALCPAQSRDTKFKLRKELKVFYVCWDEKRKIIRNS